MQPDILRQLLDAVAEQRISPTLAFDKLWADFEPVEEFAKIDHQRSLRTGFPEVIWGPGKTPEQIIKIMQVMLQLKFYLIKRVYRDQPLKLN